MSSPIPDNGGVGEQVGDSDRYWFRCPACRNIGTIDDDQRRGRVSIDCGACHFHETNDWSRPPAA